MSVFQRLHNDADGSVSFIATLDAADALRADPESICQLEDNVRAIVEEVSGEEQPSRRAQSRRRAWMMLRGLVILVLGVGAAIATLYALVWVLVFLATAAISGILAGAELAWSVFQG